MKLQVAVVGLLLPVLFSTTNSPSHIYRMVGASPSVKMAYQITSYLLQLPAQPTVATKVMKHYDEPTLYKPQLVRQLFNPVCWITTLTLFIALIGAMLMCTTAVISLMTYCICSSLVHKFYPSHKPYRRTKVKNKRVSKVKRTGKVTLRILLVLSKLIAVPLLDYSVVRNASNTESFSFPDMNKSSWLLTASSGVSLSYNDARKSAAIKRNTQRAQKNNNNTAEDGPPDRQCHFEKQPKKRQALSTTYPNSKRAKMCPSADDDDDDDFMDTGSRPQHHSADASKNTKKKQSKSIPSTSGNQGSDSSSTYKPPDLSLMGRKLKSALR